MAEVNFLEMSDDEILKRGVPQLTPVATEEEPAHEPESEAESEPESEPAKAESEQAEEQEEEQADAGESEAEAESEDKSKPAEKVEAEDVNPLSKADADLGDPPKAGKKVEPKEKEAKPAEAKKTDPVVKGVEGESTGNPAEDFMKAVLAPFKANGREMKVSTPDEVRTLMQQGANYNKKMEQLKPNLAIIKQLEQNDLLDNAKLGFLIDLHKKNPEAIARLIKDSGIDPLDIDQDKVDGYVPNTYAVSESQMDFDAILDELKDNEYFQPVIAAVANEWDIASQRAVAASPDVLRVLSKHKEIGAYDMITDEVERRKALGQLRGVPALQAYRDVGDELEAAGKFDAFKAPAKKEEKPTLPVKKTVAAVKAKPAEDPAVIQKRKAAASTATAAGKANEVPVNILAMSDAEFEKLDLSTL